MAAVLISSLFSIHFQLVALFVRTLGHSGRGRTTHCVALAVLIVAGAVPPTCFAQGQDAEYVVYTDAPRLFLNQRRMRLMKRERERESMRWMQFEALMAGNAAMPEPGFASALYGAVTGLAGPCQAAAKWAAAANVSDPAQARQMALVFDWCQDVISEAQATAVSRKLGNLIKSRATDPKTVRSATLAAIALSDVESAGAQAYLSWAVEVWWRGSILPRLKNGEQPFATRTDVFAMTELLHVIRDNLRLDLRDGAEKWFDELPPLLLLSYYPQAWPAPENEYRIPAYEGSGEPNLNDAALARASEMALVAYDTNAQANQFLQGWLMLDRFMMRGTFGAPYELLWANPYQPGLSFTYMPDLFHSNGRLMIRSSWDEDASWFSYDNGKAQAFQNGQRIAVRQGTNLAPLKMGVAMVFFPPQGLRFETGWLPPPEPEERQNTEEVAFVLGLEPNTIYDVEVDDEEMYEARTDRGGILELKFMRGRKAGVRINKFTPLTQ